MRFKTGKCNEKMVNRHLQEMRTIDQGEKDEKEDKGRGDYQQYEVGCHH